MPDLRYWLAFVTAFTAILCGMMVLALIVQYLEEKKMTSEGRMLRALVKIFILAVVAVTVIAVLVVLAAKAFAQEPHKHRPQDLAIHHKFYKTWMMPDNRAVSCCHDDDCQPAEARRLPNGQWEARQEGDKGDFTPIPPRKVDMGLPDSPDAPDARAHLCGRRAGPTSDFFVYCFIAGQGG
jgi:hypothetical protein